MRRIDPVIRRWQIYDKGVNSAKRVVGCFFYNLIDKAQRHPYWTFRVGRSMFDVH